MWFIVPEHLCWLLSICSFTPGIQEFPENIKNCKVLAIVEASVNPISKWVLCTWDNISTPLICFMFALCSQAWCYNLVRLSLNNTFAVFRLPEGFTQLLSLTQLYLNDAFLEFLPASFGRSGDSHKYRSFVIMTHFTLKYNIDWFPCVKLTKNLSFHFDRLANNKELENINSVLLSLQDYPQGSMGC